MHLLRRWAVLLATVIAALAGSAGLQPPAQAATTSYVDTGGS